MRKISDEQIRARMVELRTNAEKTQTQCANALGVAQNTYAEMESGECPVRRRDLVTLSVLYGLNLRQAFPSYLEPMSLAS